MTTSTVTIASLSVTTATANANGGIMATGGSSPFTISIPILTASTLTATTGHGGGFYLGSSG